MQVGKGQLTSSMCPEWYVALGVQHVWALEAELVLEFGVHV